MLHDSEIARRENGRVELRPGGLRVRWDLADLTTADGHDVRGSFVAAIRALADPSERRMLEEALLSSRASVTTRDLAEHFAPALHAAANRQVRAQAADVVISDAAKPDLIAALVEAAKPVAFGAGLEILPPYQIDLESPSLRKLQVETMQRQLAEKRATEQVNYLQRSAEMFKQFKALRDSLPQLSPGQILEQMSPNDQADVLRSILQASAKPADGRDLWAVAGPYLVRVDARKSSPKTELLPLPPTLGPLRSVQPAGSDSNALLVGARSGVMWVDPSKPDEAKLLQHPSVNSALGFNRAVLWNGEVWATHSEAGLVGWSLDQPNEPRVVVQSGPTSFMPFSPKNLQVLDDNRLLGSTGNRLFTVARDGTILPMTLEPRSDIVGLVPADDWVGVVHEDGEICLRDRQSLAAICSQRRCGRITAAAPLPWLGTARLLLATEEGPIYCVGFDDELVTQYASTHRGLRAVAGTADLVAAVSADRQRLVVWLSWDGRKPATEIHLAGIAKHRVADVDFG